MTGRRTAAERSAQQRANALMRWAKEDPTANAERGQAGLLERFRRDVLADDPHVTEPELTRRAECLRRAYMIRLSMTAARARRPKPS